MTAFLATKLKNQLLALDPQLVVQLKNVAVNGAKMGCTGFVTDPSKNRVVYISTDNNTQQNAGCFRVARHTKDYTGGRNQFAAHADLAQSAVSLFGSPHFDRELALR